MSRRPEIRSRLQRHRHVAPLYLVSARTEDTAEVGSMTKHRMYGSIRKLPSGRYQARYRDPATNPCGSNSS